MTVTSYILHLTSYILQVRVDAHPASYDGHGDRLHFCQPGPADWALDVLVRQITSEQAAAKRGVASSLKGGSRARR